MGHATNKLHKLMTYVELLANAPGGVSDLEAARQLNIGVMDIWRYRTSDLAKCVGQKMNEYGHPVAGKYTLVRDEQWYNFARAIVRAMKE